MEGLLSYNNGIISSGQRSDSPASSASSAVQKAVSMRPEEGLRDDGYSPLLNFRCLQLSDRIMSQMISKR